MIQSAITVCLVPEARQGPFVFHEGLEDGCFKAAQLGFDGVEIFARSAEEIHAKDLRRLLGDYPLKLAAMGTGAGWIVHKLRLTDPDPETRRRARDYVSAIVDLAGSFGAPAIIGSMQGRFEDQISREQALGWLAEALEQLGPRAYAAGIPLLFEPLNRYETNLLNTVTDSVNFLKSLRTRNVKLLCDLFHMNIEEHSIADAVREAGPLVGHVHFADSNRRAVGMGHTECGSISRALHEIGFSGYVSAEAFPLPNSETAARETIHAFHKWFPPIPKPQFTA
jgi:sugar phosphate isomerase/epimerase